MTLGLSGLCFLGLLMVSALVTSQVEPETQNTAGNRVSGLCFFGLLMVSALVTSQVEPETQNTAGNKGKWFSVFWGIRGIIMQGGGNCGR
ncbi:hypothetical protein NDU88_007675 [Pleurodeles waltl]|uniref:Uncharacterized protein n=1 Tax=Pleurodeles waltl TaxID=8319 RepID=A0AAV7U0D8_PLEWA|nr:hypothetical protein NDU88_007675 [Pleurodeles waltl]